MENLGLKYRFYGRMGVELTWDSTQQGYESPTSVLSEEWRGNSHHVPRKKQFGSDFVIRIGFDIWQFRYSRGSKDKQGVDWSLFEPKISCGGNPEGEGFWE